MCKIIRFVFEDQPSKEIDVEVDAKIINFDEMQDAIASYVEAVEIKNPEMLVNDLLMSFKYKYTILAKTTERPDHVFKI